MKRFIATEIRSTKIQHPSSAIPMNAIEFVFDYFTEENGRIIPDTTRTSIESTVLIPAFTTLEVLRDGLTGTIEALVEQIVSNDLTDTVQEFGERVPVGTTVQ
jgi:hypothetical protein